MKGSIHIGSHERVTVREGLLLQSFTRELGGICVEFASREGSATIYLAKGIEEKGRGWVIAIEKPGEYLALEGNLKGAGIRGLVEIRRVPYRSDPPLPVAFPTMIYFNRFNSVLRGVFFETISSLSSKGVVAFYGYPENLSVKRVVDTILLRSDGPWEILGTQGRVVALTRKR